MPTKQRARCFFLLSPANLAGSRAELILGGTARCPLAVRLRNGGAPLGEIFSFVSGLYFRGKLAYASAFAQPVKVPGDSVFIITSSRGLVSPHASTALNQLHEMAEVPINTSNPRYRVPLERDVALLAAHVRKCDKVVLLGSVATPKYVEPLRNILRDRLMIPAEFIGLGDMSRGALMLRAVREGKELTYVSIAPPQRVARTPLA